MEAYSYYQPSIEGKILPKLGMAKTNFEGRIFKMHQLNRVEWITFVKEKAW